jgi:putative CRISPR-associated protein (TIGR02620 family)
MMEEKLILDWVLMHPNRFPNWESVGWRMQEFQIISPEQKSHILQICKMWDVEKKSLPKAAVAPIIVTRHAGLVAWLETQEITGEVISHVTSPDQVAGRVVYGALPLHLAAEAEEVVVVDMPRLPAELRGIDLTPEQMEEAGATLAHYRVERL